MQTLRITAGMFFAVAAVACAPQPNIESSVEDISLVECSRDDACDRGEVCLEGFCSTGDRCDSTRECPDASVCRGGDAHHCMVVERDRSDINSCPRGSVEGRVLCGPGFENSVVSREPHCETCEPDVDLARRCRNAGYSIQECRRIILSLSDDGNGNGDRYDILRRCRNAGYSAQECRRLLWDDGDDMDSIFARCREAGYSAEECRRLTFDDDESFDYEDLVRRCRNAGYNEQECRRLVAN